MVKRAKYAIFKTRWGYFGLAADENGLFRTALPCPTRKITKSYLLNGLNDSQFDKNLLRSLQKQIIAYFEGKPVRFDTPLVLDKLSSFTRKVLAACRKIPAGQTVSYSQLAGMIGNPKAGRAVGSALAKNPIPLIIPCHRVIHSDGSFGNFSSPRHNGLGHPFREASLTGGGTDTKKKLIALESNEN
jgi:O-6-methylguanine DNA methyltransferase